MSRITRDLNSSPHYEHCTSNGSSSDVQRLVRQTSKVPQIAIVGAGIAGLRCADVLIHNGAKVTIFEARDRIGGRVHQTHSGGYLMDMGPNWIHGSENNPIAEIAKRTNTETHDWEERQAIFDRDGKRFEDGRATAAVESVWSTIVKAFKYSDKNSAKISPSRSLMDYFKEEVPKTETEQQVICDTLECAHMWGAFVGDPIECQSLKFFFLEETIDGENAFMAGTYKKVLSYIASTALSRAEVKLNSEIVRFDKPPHSTNGPAVCLTSSDGQAYDFDEVVVTCPLGWLKRHHLTAFKTPLPPRLARAISSVSYGRLEKIYVTFPTAFWFNESDGSSFPSFSHYLKPSYVNRPESIPWNQECVNLATLPRSTAHPTLLFYVYGPCATKLVDLITDLPFQSPRYNAVLDEFTKPFYSLLPNFDARSSSCTPTAFLATLWQSDPFAGNGSYTNFQVGAEAADEDIEVMREGMGVDRGIWFAGEHTAPFVALGTTTGAYWAGEGVARRIISAYALSGEDNSESNMDVEPKAKEIGSSKADVANVAGMGI